LTNKTLLKLDTTPKSKQHKTAIEDYPGSGASYDIQPGNEMGLLYNALKVGWLGFNGTLSTQVAAISCLRKFKVY